MARMAEHGTIFAAMLQEFDGAARLLAVCGSRGRDRARAETKRERADDRGGEREHSCGHIGELVVARSSIGSPPGSPDGQRRGVYRSIAMTRMRRR